MKIYLKLPDPAALSPFLETEKTLPFTYAPVGQTAEPDRKAEGFDNDRQRVAIGSGLADFVRAKQALRAWAHFPAPWTKILPPDTPLQAGVTLAMFFRLFGLWWRNSCRIVYVVDESLRFGFAYGTLPGHLECGEEIFQVELDEDGTVWYELRAFSRPRHPLARLGYPFVRFLQEKFRQDSAAAMRRSLARTFLGWKKKVEPFFPPDAWLLRGLLFVLAAFWLWPGSLFGHDYGKLPLAFAALLIVPAGLLLAARHFPELRRPWAGLWMWLLPAALTGVVALALLPGWVAGALTFPWLAVCGWVAWVGLRLIFASSPRNPFSALFPFSNPTPAPSSFGEIVIAAPLDEFVDDNATPAPPPAGEGSLRSVGGGVDGGEGSMRRVAEAERKGSQLAQSGSRIAMAAGLLYLVIGGISWFSDRAGLCPLGFGDDIVRLTALHFHYAGFALPLLTGLAARFLPGLMTRLTAWAVVLGVPLTALGITATQIGWGPFLETFAAVFMALAGLMAGLTWLALGFQRANGFLTAAGVVLCGSMLLALTYGLRGIFPDLALSLDWMRALHGSLNGFVAVPLGLLGFWYSGKADTK